MFTMATPSEIMLDFEMYTGKDTCKDYGLGISNNIVLHLAEVLPKNQNFKIHTDNWFTSLDLAVALKKEGLLLLGTCRNDRMGKCALKNEKDLKTSGLGSHDYKVETNNEILILRWYDRKPINFVTTYAKIEPVTKCKRWSKEHNSHIEIDRPNTVATYNQLMGGVDLCDMLFEMYRINI